MTLTRVRAGAKSDEGSKLSGVGAAKVTVLARAKKLVVSVGEQRFSPVQFFSFGVGALEMTLDLEDGDDPAELGEEAIKVLRGIQKEVFPPALAEHMALVRDSEKFAKGK